MNDGMVLIGESKREGLWESMSCEMYQQSERVLELAGRGLNVL